MIEKYQHKSEFVRDTCLGMQITPENTAELLAWGKGDIDAVYDFKTGKLCFKAIHSIDGTITKGYYGDYIIKRIGFTIYKKKSFEADYERVN